MVLRREGCQCVRFLTGVISEYGSQSTLFSTPLRRFFCLGPGLLNQLDPTAKSAIFQPSYAQAGSVGVLGCSVWDITTCCMATKPRISRKRLSSNSGLDKSFSSRSTAARITLITTVPVTNTETADSGAHPPLTFFVPEAAKRVASRSPPEPLDTGLFWGRPASRMNLRTR